MLSVANCFCVVVVRRGPKDSLNVFLGSNKVYGPHKSHLPPPVHRDAADLCVCSFGSS